MSRRGWWLTGIACGIAAAIVIVLQTEPGQTAAEYAWTKIRGGYTVADRIEMHGEEVKDRVAPLFADAGVAYPPRQVALIAFKDTRRLELHARDDERAPWRKIATYPIRGMSGNLGPKLREGDRQVPEGLYRAEFLNANSRYHLAIRLDYPNAFDRQRGAADGRDNLGSDIMVHGSSASIGCLAMGNEAAEDLFIIAALAGKENVRIVVAPTDFRDGRVAPEMPGPHWVPELYRQIRLELRNFPHQGR
jgi:L,D-transpeptidase-like protein